MALTALLAFAGAFGCSEPREPSGDRPLEVLVPSAIETLDPRHAVDAYSVRATRMVHAGLVGLDPESLRPIPAVATSWEWVDAVRLRLVLREGARFHSGTPLKPQDVVATLESLRSPVVASRQAHTLEAIARVQPDGPSAVLVTLSHPHATLLTDLEVPILRADQAASAPQPNGTLDGLGPYRVARVIPGAVELVPAPSAGIPPGRRPLVLRTVRDENARALRLQAGRADIAVNVVSPTLVPALEADGALHVERTRGANLTYLVVRMGRAPFDEGATRQALSLGIDRAKLAETLLVGSALPASGVVPPNHWAYTQPSERLPHDPARARELLGGRRIPTTLLTSTDRHRRTLARAMAQSLSQVGFDVEVVPMDFGTLLKRLNAGDFELAALQLPELGEPNTMRLFLHSNFVPPSGANRGRVNLPELDAILDRGATEQDPARRKEIYRDLDHFVRENLPIIPLWHEDQVVVTSARARGFLPGSDGRWGRAALLR